MVMLGQAKSLVFGAAKKTFNYVKSIPGASAAMATAVPKEQGTVIGPALKLIGFGKKGVTGKSLAAGIQSEIGNTVAKGPFASLQSSGAGGYGVAVINSIIQGTTTAAGLGKETKRGKNGSKKDKSSSNNTK
ncbi:hypothetical protein ACHAP5_002788 [Fusarium lateritium]